MSSGVARRASIFRNGANQAVRLPQELRFPADVKEVRIRKQGDGLFISPVKPNWSSFFAMQVEVPDDFLENRTIHLRSHATRYDGVHAGYRYLQLHHQAQTSDTD